LGGRLFFQRKGTYRNDSDCYGMDIDTHAQAIGSVAFAARAAALLTVLPVTALTGEKRAEHAQTTDAPAPETIRPVRVIVGSPYGR